MPTAKPVKKLKSQRRSKPMLNVDGLKKSNFKMMAHKAGVKELSSGVYEELKLRTTVFLEEAVKNAITYMEHRRKHTLKSEDVEMALPGVAGGQKVYRTQKEGDTGRCEIYEAQLGKAREYRKSKKDQVVEAFDDDTDSETKAARRTSRGTAAIRKIKFYQKQHDCFYFAQAPFERYIRELGNNYKSQWQLSSNAAGLLQLATEDFIIRLISKAYLITLNAGRTVLQSKDVKTLNQILDH